MNAPNCPKCGKDDKVEKVSGIVAREKVCHTTEYSNLYSGVPVPNQLVQPVTGFPFVNQPVRPNTNPYSGIPVPNQPFQPVTGFPSLNGISQNSRQIYGILKSYTSELGQTLDFSPQGYREEGIWRFFFLSGILLLLGILCVVNGSFLGFLLFIILALVVFFVGKKRRDDSKIQAQRDKKAREIWETLLYYCSHDDEVFIPNFPGLHGPREEMKSLLYKWIPEIHATETSLGSVSFRDHLSS